MCSGQPVFAWEWLIMLRRVVVVSWRARPRRTDQIICIRFTRLGLSCFLFIYLFFVPPPPICSVLVSSSVLFYLCDVSFLHSLCFLLTTVTWKILPYLYFAYNTLSPQAGRERSGTRFSFYKWEVRYRTQNESNIYKTSKFDFVKIAHVNNYTGFSVDFHCENRKTRCRLGAIFLPENGTQDVKIRAVVLHENARSFNSQWNTNKLFNRYATQLFRVRIQCSIDMGKKGVKVSFVYNVIIVNCLTGDNALVGRK